MAVRIIIADDHTLVRKGFRLLLEDESDFQVIGETSNGLEAVLLVEQEYPDVLIVDQMMPGINGSEVVRQVKKRAPQTHVIVLSLHPTESYVAEAMACGASGYVLKGGDGNDLVQAVRAAICGRRFLSHPLSEQAIDAYIEKADALMNHDPYQELTDREREVLHLAVEGLTNPEIAAMLSLSPRTVESHRATMMHKLRLRTHTDLIRFAMRRGIIE